MAGLAALGCYSLDFLRGPVGKVARVGVVSLVGRRLCAAAAMAGLAALGRSSLYLLGGTCKGNGQFRSEMARKGFWTYRLAKFPGLESAMLKVLKAMI